MSTTRNSFLSPSTRIRSKLNKRNASASRRVRARVFTKASPGAGTTFFLRPSSLSRPELFFSDALLLWLLLSLSGRNALSCAAFNRKPFVGTTSSQSNSPCSLSVPPSLVVCVKSDKAPYDPAFTLPLNLCKLRGGAQSGFPANTEPGAAACGGTRVCDRRCFPPIAGDDSRPSPSPSSLSPPSKCKPCPTEDPGPPEERPPMESTLPIRVIVRFLANDFGSNRRGSGDGDAISEEFVVNVFAAGTAVPSKPPFAVSFRDGKSAIPSRSSSVSRSRHDDSPSVAPPRKHEIRETLTAPVKRRVSSCSSCSKSSSASLSSTSPSKSRASSFPFSFSLCDPFPRFAMGMGFDPPWLVPAAPAKTASPLSAAELFSAAARRLRLAFRAPLKSGRLSRRVTTTSFPTTYTLNKPPP
mmetsp:Transcript_855/g.3289  ORF Transcript_855/g.3289 Transcript_855/m.3289 type:complete len:412 (+) Transcript_855:3587-4822(+)